MLLVPQAFAATTRRREGAAGQQWLEGLPSLVERLVHRWHLSPDSPVLHGSVALVLPVRRAGGEPAALKVSWVDVETRHEARALTWWAGRGAVPLLEAAPQDGALLLGRLDPHRSLLDLGEHDAVAAAGPLLRQLQVPPPPALPPPALPDAAGRARRWAQELPRRWRSLGLPGPAHLIGEVTSTCEQLAAAPGRQVLLHGDYHYGNVLAAPAGIDADTTTADTTTADTTTAGGPHWSAVDPKPLVGGGEFDLLPLLRNRWADLAATGDPQRACRRRLDQLVEHTGLDGERARAWALVRTVDDALWGLAHDDARFTSTAWAITEALR